MDKESLRRMRNRAVLAAGGAGAALLISCGGGGGEKNVSPTVVPTLSDGALVDVKPTLEPTKVVEIATNPLDRIKQSFSKNLKPEFSSVVIPQLSSEVNSQNGQKSYSTRVVLDNGDTLIIADADSVAGVNYSKDGLPLETDAGFVTTKNVPLSMNQEVFNEVMSRYFKPFEGKVSEIDHFSMSNGAPVWEVYSRQSNGTVTARSIRMVNLTAQNGATSLGMVVLNCDIYKDSKLNLQNSCFEEKLPPVLK